MAKIKGPLFSINAIGTIDNKLTYRGRKGFNDVKKYTKTVNPNTIDQQVQKGFFANAIDAWSIDGYSAADKFAWDQFAKTKKVITSGFNRFTGFKIVAEKEGFTWSKLTNCIIYDIAGAGFKVDVNVSSDLSGILYLGTSKYSMLTEFVGVFSVNKYTFTITGIPDLTKVFFYIKNTSAGEVARTGIYSQFHVGGFVPIVIDMGNPAINRPNYSAVRTAIDRNNPANATGKIHTIEIYARTTMMADIGIFYQPDPIGFPDNLSTRDWENIPGNIPVGFNSYPVDLDVVAGDFIGIAIKYGTLDMDTATPCIGVWHNSGDRIPCVNTLFFQQANWTLSLHGIGSN